MAFLLTGVAVTPPPPICDVAGTGEALDFRPLMLLSRLLFPRLGVGGPRAFQAHWIRVGKGDSTAVSKLGSLRNPGVPCGVRGHPCFSRELLLIPSVIPETLICFWFGGLCVRFHFRQDVGVQGCLKTVGVWGTEPGGGGSSRSPGTGAWVMEVMCMQSAVGLLESLGSGGWPPLAGPVPGLLIGPSSFVCVLGRLGLCWAWGAGGGGMWLRTKLPQSLGSFGVGRRILALVGFDSLPAPSGHYAQRAQCCKLQRCKETCPFLRTGRLAGQPCSLPLKTLRQCHLLDSASHSGLWPLALVAPGS